VTIGNRQLGKRNSN